MSESINQLVSTIIPNYNNALYIEECVNSILAQTYSNIEIIIVDDASTDGSQDIIRKLVMQHDNVQAILNSINVGITKNRIKGIEAASGQYINYLDSDDFIQNPIKLQAEMELIYHFKHKYNLDVISFSDVHISDKSGSIVNRFRDIKPVKEGFILNELITRQCLIPQNFTFHRDLYNNVGGHDCNIPFYENWDLKIRLSAKYQYVFTGVPGFVYRRHGKGLSNAGVIRHKEWVAKIAKKNLELVTQDEHSIIKKKIAEMENNIEEELDYINQHLQKETKV